MQTLRTPGVYWQEITIQPPPLLETGVPAFLGYVVPQQADRYNRPVKLNTWPQFANHFKPEANPSSYVMDCVQAFFENGGRRCYVVPLEPVTTSTNAIASLSKGLDAIGQLDDLDIVCAPDVMLPLVETFRADRQRYQFDLLTLRRTAQEMQRRILSHCDSLGNRIALLDSYPFYDELSCTPAEVVQQRGGLEAANGALYYPWVQLASGRSVPPCGHIAGIIAQTDQTIGVHKAPPTHMLTGVVDIAYPLDDTINGELYPQQINCLRAFSGRGVRVWGARTLQTNTRWAFVNNRRLLLTVGRWIQLILTEATFEANTPMLWAQIEREVGAYLNTLLLGGALTGSSAEEAYYVRCNADTNPPAARENGMVIAQVGLALTVPNEFIEARVVIHASNAQFILPE